MSGDQRPANDGRRRHLAPVDGGDAARVAQRGDRVEILDGRHAGRTGHVVGVRLVLCLGVRRYPVVILDGPGGRLPRHFDDDALRILD